MTMTMLMRGDINYFPEQTNTEIMKTAEKIISKNSKALGLVDIAILASEITGVSLKDMRSPWRHQKFVYARQLYIYAAVKHTTEKYERIADVINRKHPIVVWSRRTIYNLGEVDKKVKADLIKISELCRRGN